MREIQFVNILTVDDKLKEKVRQWRNTQKIRKSMLTQHIITRSEHCKWIENLKQRSDWKFWVVFADSFPVGSVYLENINYRDLSSEWGFYIGESDYRGKGLSKRILLKLLEMFFDQMEFKTLFTKALSKNIEALNLYKKFNFEKIDEFPLKNKHDVTLLKFCKKDWTTLREKLRNG